MLEEYLTPILLGFLIISILATGMSLKKWLIDLISYEKQDFSKWFNENIPKITEELADKLKTSIGKSIGGVLSGPARLESGLQQALTEDVLSQQNPLLTSILDMFPGAKKYITRNPGAVAQLLPLLQGFLGSKQGLSSSQSPNPYRKEY